MNSLEFINIEIAKVKSDYKKHIRYGQTNFAIADEKRLKDLQQIKTELEEYKKLKVKATAKKPIRFKNSIYISNPKCPTCKTIPHTCTQKYCDECGQALDWSEEGVKVEDE